MPETTTVDERPHVEPHRQRVVTVPADALIERLTYSDARATLEAAEGLDVDQELAAEANAASASRSDVLDAIAKLLASGELVLLKRDQRGVELDLPSSLFEGDPETQSRS